eukprot:CAMPEP_0183333750 /NCGR_PEP_ID=MMETSP0164_2-20130417/2568_1 /TAXON_ID=221442 /ORGANISM="Coccolithus pelagicus ssp braarudi, Strain PLY182g" /LENGTH=127 /DNA_ID=CAMNT_0025502755 /DNA_START=367 /DNA_END=748 /DNA_ORIENTATION=-
MLLHTATCTVLALDSVPLLPPLAIPPPRRGYLMIRPHMKEQGTQTTMAHDDPRLGKDVALGCPARTGYDLEPANLELFAMSVLAELSAKSLPLSPNFFIMLDQPDRARQAEERATKRAARLQVLMSR